MEGTAAADPGPEPKPEEPEPEFQSGSESSSDSAEFLRDRAKPEPEQPEPEPEEPEPEPEPEQEAAPPEEAAAPADDIVVVFDEPPPLGIGWAQSAAEGRVEIEKIRPLTPATNKPELEPGLLLVQVNEVNVERHDEQAVVKLMNASPRPLTLRLAHPDPELTAARLRKEAAEAPSARASALMSQVAAGATTAAEVVAQKTKVAAEKGATSAAETAKVAAKVAAEKVKW